MGARVWRGFTTPANADRYQAMLKPELLPGLSKVRGFRGSYLLRRDLGAEVEFVTIILFDPLDDIRAIAGEHYDVAIIPDERRPLLVKWDDQAVHYQVEAVVGAGASPT